MYKFVYLFSMTKISISLLLCFEVQLLPFSIYRRLTVVYISMNNINRRLVSLYNIYYFYKYFSHIYKFDYAIALFKIEDILLPYKIFLLLYLIHLYLLFV